MRYKEKQSIPRSYGVGHVLDSSIVGRIGDVDRYFRARLECVDALLKAMHFGSIASNEHKTSCSGGCESYRSLFSNDASLCEMR